MIMQKILIFLYDQMADFEITLAAGGLNTKNAAEIVPIGYGGTVTSMGGLKYQVSTTVKEALDMEDVCGLLIPGGTQCDCREELLTLIRRLDEEELLLAAICAGPQYLARAGVLTGRAYTTSLREWTEEDVQRFGGSDPFPRDTFRDERIVRDGHIITAYGEAFVDFAVEIFDRFGLFTDSEEKKAYLKEIRGV
jgi:putative intracellular protease/amidase